MPSHHQIIRHRVGGWLPQDQAVLEAWIAKKLAIVNHPDRKDKAFHPVIAEFQQLIENDPNVWMGFHQMFEQVPTKPPYNLDPTKRPQVRDYMTMLRMFDLILTTPPDFEDNDLVGFPINAILDWPMGTAGGLTAFINPVVDAQFKKVLNAWGVFLTSPASRSVLTKAANGWFGPAATKAIPNFASTYVCDPNVLYYGYTSWDNFFIRLFRPGVRPVIFPTVSYIINCPCESTVYKIAYNIKARDSFWLKGEPYSLYHMLNNDPLAPQFPWIVKTVLIPGTYYAESPYHGFTNPDGPDPAAPNLSQAFITALATRGLIFIQSDDPVIGLMCFIAVGMCEVSTCQITVKQGDIVKKGDQLGMFHFGGSTQCLVFRPQTKLSFNPDYTVGSTVPLNGALAAASAVEGESFNVEGLEDSADDDGCDEEA